MKQVCLVCGYVYDSSVGDPVGGVSPGTKFDELPPSWVCPECGAAEEMFELVEAPEGDQQ
jgi:rubredoxin